MRFAYAFALALFLNGCDALVPGYTQVRLDALTLYAVPQTNPSTGENWDPSGGGAADPFVVITNHAGHLLLRTPAKSNLTAYPTNFDLGLTLDRLDLPINIYIYDEDVAVHDLIAGWEGVRPSELGGPLYSSTSDFNGHDGRQMATLHLSWSR